MKVGDVLAEIARNKQRGLRLDAIALSPEGLKELRDDIAARATVSVIEGSPRGYPPGCWGTVAGVEIWSEEETVGTPN